MKEQRTTIRRLAIGVGLCLVGLAACDEAVAAEGAGQSTRVALGKGLGASFPAGWTVAPDPGNGWRAVHVEGGGRRPDAVLHARIDVLPSHEKALARLGEIEHDAPASAQFRQIGGWPALERKLAVRYTFAGEGDGDARTQGHPTGATTPAVWNVTTAVAVGVWVVELQTRLEPGAPESLADEAVVIGRRLRLPLAPANAKDDVAGLLAGKHRVRVDTPITFAPSLADALRPALVPGSAVAIGTPGGEMEAAVSSNGAAMMVVQSCGPLFSKDSGKSFLFVPTPPGGGGDCGVSWGASGAFYVSQVGPGAPAQSIFVWPLTPAAQAAPSPKFVATPAVVNLTGVPNAQIDQPHVVADPWSLSNQNKDRLYLVWQGDSNWTPYITCSADGGATWLAPRALRSTLASGFPRAAVAPNGLVYVVSQTSDAGVAFQLFILSKCEDGLASTSNAIRSFVYSRVACPVPGLDRCNDGNMLSSPTVAIDQNGVVYVGYAHADASGGENVSVWASRNGGNDFFSADAVNLNGPVSARRYLPWLTTWNGSVYAGWYDRRGAVPFENDRTHFYVGSASWISGTLTPSPEVDVSRLDDFPCKTPFPSGVRSVDDCQSCLTTPPASCPATATPNGGVPKYGDYKGIAAGGGLLLGIWAAATNIATPSAGISAYASVSALCPGGAPPCGGVCCSTGESCAGGACCDKAAVCAGPSGANVCCTLPSSCGGGGTPGLCGCKPLSPAIGCVGICGTVPDGCGGQLRCQNCPDHQICFASQCLDRGCVPHRCAAGTHWDSDQCRCLPGLPH